MLSLYALSLALMAAPQDPPNEPLVELLEWEVPEDYSLADLKTLRASIEQERDEKLETSKKAEEDGKRKLAADRHELEVLNKLSSVDTAETAKKRNALHLEISALEKGIRERSLEREQTLPATYELKLTKLWLAEHWPDRRAEILQKVREGEARDRRHGDAEDIGYRKLVKNPEKDIETGQQAARQMVSGGWLPFELQDNEVQIYVRQMAARIAANSDLKVPLHITVLDSPEPRAIALPGGFLYITSGVIHEAANESELAGVLSREIARIAARHATRVSRMAWVSKLFVPVTQIATGIFAGGPANPGAYYGLNYGIEGVSGLVGRVLNGTTEKFQMEADQLGIQYAWKAGYDPRGFIGFLDSLDPQQQEKFLTNEPPFRERLLKMFTEIRYLPATEQPASDSSEFYRIRLRVAR